MGTYTVWVAPFGSDEHASVEQLQDRDLTAVTKVAAQTIEEATDMVDALLADGWETVAATGSAVEPVDDNHRPVPVARQRSE